MSRYQSSLAICCVENKPPNKGEQEKPDERKVKFVAKDLLNVSCERVEFCCGLGGVLL